MFNNQNPNYNNPNYNPSYNNQQRFPQNYNNNPYYNNQQRFPQNYNNNPYYNQNYNPNYSNVPQQFNANKPNFVEKKTNNIGQDHTDNADNYSKSNLYDENKANSMVPQFKEILNLGKTSCPNGSDTVTGFGSAFVNTDNLKKLTADKKQSYQTFFDKNINKQDIADRYGHYHLKKTDNNSILAMFGSDKLVEFSRDKITGLSIGYQIQNDITTLFMTYPNTSENLSYYSLEYNLVNNKYKAFIHDGESQKKYLIKVKFNKKDYQCNFSAHSNYFMLTVKKNNDPTNKEYNIMFGPNTGLNATLERVKKQIKENNFDIDISFKSIDRLAEGEVTEEATGWFCGNCCCCCCNWAEYDTNNINLDNNIQKK